ncbi:MAG: gamma-glutamyl-gamma-aminobutyrate hydrolase family protein [bacterium]|nr:gamma-glutamyl-gamma-aminobutyrate hydrolase family protein [bacterium]
MDILVVDNGSYYLDNLIRLLPQSTVEVISYNKLLGITCNNYDAIILSGGHGLSVINHEKNYEAELELIRSIQVPLLGICLGSELIAFAYGSQLVRMEHKEKGLIHIEITKPDPVFRSVYNILVYESHRWAISTLSKELVQLAISKDGIEVFRHASRPIYGVQFHPEAFVEVTNGNVLLKNFFRLVSEKTQKFPSTD